MKAFDLLKDLGQGLEEGLKDLGVPQHLLDGWAENWSLLMVDAADGTSDVRATSIAVLQAMMMSRELGRIYGHG